MWRSRLLVFVVLALQFWGSGSDRTLSAQAPSVNWTRFTLSGGAVLRDTRDYDTAHRLGYASSFGYEEAVGPRSSLAIAVGVGGFRDLIPQAVPLGLLDRIAAVGPEVTRKDSWDPSAGSNGHSNLAVFGADVTVRRYLTSSSVGPFVGATLGVLDMVATAQHTFRPTAGALVGYHWNTDNRVQEFVEARILSAMFDVEHGFDAKSPRWLMSSLVGVSISR